MDILFQVSFGIFLCVAMLFTNSDGSSKVAGTRPQYTLTTKFKRLTCTSFRKDIIEFDSCTAKPVSRNNTLISMDGRLHRQINDIWFAIKFYKKYTVYRPFLVDVKENMCDMFKKKSGITYTRMFFAIGKQYTTLNHSCPYSGNFSIKDAPMDASKLRYLWPSGEYRVTFTSTMDSIVAAMAELYYEIKEEPFLS